MFSSNSSNSSSKQSASSFLASNDKYSLNGSKQNDTSWMFPKQASFSVPAPNVSVQPPKIPDFSAPKMPEFFMPSVSASKSFLGKSDTFEHNTPKPPSFVDIKFSGPKVPVMSQDYRAAQQENFMMQQRIMDNNRIAMENNRAAMEMNLANMRNQRMNFEQVKNRMPSMDDFGENFASSYEGQKTISKLKEWHLGLEKTKRDQSFYNPNLASKDYDEIDSVKKSSGKVEGKKFRGLEPKDFAGGRITPRQYAKLLFGDDKIDNKLVINQQGIQNVDKETKEFSEYLNSFVDGNLSQEQKHQRELRAEINEMIRNHPYKLRRKNQLEEGVVNSLVIGAGRAYVEVGQGAKQFAMEIGEKVGIVDANAVQKYSESIAREKELYVLTPVAKSTAGKAGEFAGNTVIFSAVPCGSGLKGYKLAASSAASGAVVMGLHPVEDGQGLRERGRNAAVGAAAAVVVAPAVGKFAEVSNQAIVRLYERGRVSGGVSVGKINGFKQTGHGGFFEYADDVYNSIRSSNSDIKSIAKNTGIKEQNIQKVKEHLFHNEHLLDRYVEYGIPAEMKVFDSDIAIANAWKRLELGTHTKYDLQLLRHEAAEAWYMRRHGPSYTNAHNAAEKRYRAPDLNHSSVVGNKKNYGSLE